jgi:galactose mutarotase-like enzyme
LTFLVDERPTNTMNHISVRSVNDLQAVVLSNEVLELVVFPETGARIYSIFHKPSGTEFLWHHPHNPPRLTKTGEVFDDIFPGGWDELFPSCDACEFQGTQIPDHGELWAVPWEWSIEKTDNLADCLYTGVTAKLFPIRFERYVHLDTQQPKFHLRYRLTNLSSNQLNLIWGIHPLFAISPHHRLELPPGTMKVDLSSGEKFGRHGQLYDWPYLLTPEGVTDMRQLPGPEAKAFAGHYCVQPSRNWFALTDTKKQVGLAVVYPAEIFRSLWLWQSYGGWRDWYHLAVEPWVGHPVRLGQAIDAGNYLSLKGHEVLEYSVSVVIYTGTRTASVVEENVPK